MFEFVIRKSSSDSTVYPYTIFVRTHLQMLSLSEATSRSCFVKILKLYQDFNNNNNYQSRLVYDILIQSHYQVK